MFDSPFSSQIRCKELAEQGDPEPAGAGRRRRRGSPCPGLAAGWGLFGKLYGWEGRKKGGFIPCCFLFPCASWEFVGSQHQGGFAPLLGAPGEQGCWRLPKQALSVSDQSPALFIYLLNPPTLTARAGFPLVLLSHWWLRPAASWAAPTSPVPLAGSSGHGSG